MDTQQAINLCNRVRLNIEAHDFTHPANTGILKTFKLDYDRSKRTAGIRRRIAFCKAFRLVAEIIGYKDELPTP